MLEIYEAITKSKTEYWIILNSEEFTDTTRIFKANKAKINN